jgi:hypothetical protein
VGGDVETGSIQRVGSQVQFVLVQDKTKLKVAYTGTDPLPDTFRDGAQALADGKLDKDGVFRAANASKPSAPPSMKPSRGSCPARAAPNINRAKAASRGDMENLGSLAILLAFCVALYATAASVVGRVKPQAFLVVSGQRAVYGIWVLITTGLGHPGLLADDRRFPLRLRGGALQPQHAHALQVRGLVGRAGRVAAVLELAALHLHLGGGFTNRRKHRDMMPYG